jgi:ribonuclease R
VDFETTETQIVCDENGRIEKIVPRVRNEAHRLIEEAMLAANVCSADFIQQGQHPGLFRVHEGPTPEKKDILRNYLKALGIGLGLSEDPHTSEFQKIAQATKDRPDAQQIHTMLLRSMQQAIYTPVNSGHFGLAYEAYTHFTSPIRRYSDLIVHRALERQLGLTKSGPDSSALGAMAEHISTTERSAADAEKESVRLKKLEFFQLQTTEGKRQKFRAMIMDVRNFGFFVELPEFLLTGLVHVSSLEGDFYIHEPSRGRLCGRKTKKVYQVGDFLEVAVDRVDMFKQQVDFKPA